MRLNPLVTNCHLWNTCTLSEAFVQRVTVTIRFVFKLVIPSVFINLRVLCQEGKTRGGVERERCWREREIEKKKWRAWER